MASNPSGAQRAAEARAEWVIVLPYSILVVHKRSSDVALRIDLVTRMRAAKLEVTTRVNAAKSELLILVGAPLERLEREAEHARMRKSLRSSGGYVPFNRSKRHYFGHKVLSEEFFSPAERQELVMRIMVCNHGHSGAALDVAMLRGTHTEAHLKTLPAAQLRRMLADRHPQDAPDGVGEMEVDELAAQLLDRFRTEEKVKAVIPLHSEDWQDAVIEVFRNNNYFALPRPIQLGSRDGVFQVLQRMDKAPRAAEDLPSETPVLDALRGYHGEGVATMFAWNCNMCRQLIPLGVVSMALYITSFVPDTVHVQFATNGIISMVWFQKLVQAWKRQLAAMEHTWGMEDRDQDATELAFQQAKAHSREHARELALSNLNVDEKMRVRRTRAGLQLVVLGFICILCVITHGITIAFKWVATGGGTEITAGTVVAFSLLDVFRIWGMQAVGGQVLYFLESWDDDIIQDEDRQTWQLAKSLLFDLVNHLCGLFIAVGHKSFAAGTEWVIAPPPCFSVGCREDFEIQIWSIVGLKLMLVPLLISLYEGMAYHRHKVPAATKGIRREFVALSRLMGGGSYPHAGPQEAEAVPATGRIEAKASLRRSDSYKAGSSREMGGGKAGGLSKRAGRSGVEEQLLLRHFSRRRWQHRRQLDLLILFAMLTTCATLAPLLPCVVCLWLALKIRLDAHEIVVWTQRGAADRVWGIRFCTMAMSWIAILGIFSNSISIMFITTDIEEVILILGSTYRYYIQKNATFRNIAFGSDDANCFGGICVFLTSQRAQGALYWTIWIGIVFIGLISGVVSSLVWREESYGLRRSRQRERAVQRNMGFIGVDKHSEMATLVLEDFLTRYNTTSGEDVFERPPDG